MTASDLAIFIVIQLSMIAWSHWEAYMEGDTGWKWNPHWWRIHLPRGYFYTAYHVWAFWIFAPLVFILIPLLAAGFSWRLFWLLLGSYLFGTILEDFMWFVVNPEYPLTDWNPRKTVWYPWITIGRISIPVAYIVKLLLSILIFYFYCKSLNEFY